MMEAGNEAPRWKAIGTLAKAFVAALAVALAPAAPAGAESIAYKGGDGNLWLTTPDGSRQHRVTSDGGQKIYSGPAQLDDGTVIAAANDHFFYVLNPDGSTRSGPWLAPTDNGTSSSPVGVDVEPFGGLIAYWHLHAASIGDATRSRVAFSSSDGPRSLQCNPTPCHDFYSAPHWVPGQNVVAMIDASGLQVDVQNGATETPWIGFSGSASDVSIDDFDISRSGYRAVFSMHDIANGDRELIVWDNRGLVPPAAPSTAEGFVCGMDDFANGAATPRWSPDGQSLTWSDADGIWVSPAPTAGPGQVCVIQPRLIAPGGSLPDWSAASVPGGGGGGGQDEPVIPQPEVTEKPTIEVSGKPRLRKALKKGLSVTVGCAAACEIEVEALARARKPATVGRGSGRLEEAGERRVKVKFKKKAARKLRGAKKAPLTLRATATAGSAAPATTTTKLTLKR